MEPYKQFVSNGHFGVSTVIPGPNGPKRHVGVVFGLDKNASPDSALIRYLSRYFKSRQELMRWYLQYKNQSNVKWVETKQEPKEVQGELNLT